ncbi:MAG: PilZ domain-containing protein [Deltaproteobacteria bacterium]|nr:PilZ domain-containing protein [Deltaproteobacteria bacterium]
MTLQEMLDLIDVCCQQSIPAQILFEGATEPCHGRFSGVADGKVVIEVGRVDPASLPALDNDAACSVSFQRTTRTLIFISRAEVERAQDAAVRSVKVGMPKQIAIAQARQFFRVPVPASVRLLVKVQTSADRWRIALPVDISLGGVGFSLVKGGDDDLLIGADVRVHLALGDQQLETAASVVRRAGAVFGLQFVTWDTALDANTPTLLRTIVGRVEQAWIESVFA